MTNAKLSELMARTDTVRLACTTPEEATIKTDIVHGLEADFEIDREKLEDTTYRVSASQVGTLVGKAKKARAEDGWVLCNHGVLKFMCQREH